MAAHRLFVSVPARESLAPRTRETANVPFATVLFAAEIDKSVRITHWIILAAIAWIIFFPCVLGFIVQSDSIGEAIVDIRNLLKSWLSSGYFDRSRLIRNECSGNYILGLWDIDHAEIQVDNRQHIKFDGRRFTEILDVQVNRECMPLPVNQRDCVDDSYKRFISLERDISRLFCGDGIVLSGLCLIAGDIKLMQPLDSPKRSVSIFGFRLAKNLCSLSMHLLPLKDGCTSVKDSSAKCAESHQIYFVLDSVLSIIFSISFIFRCAVKGDFSPDYAWVDVVFLLAFKGGPLNVKVLC